MKKNIAIPFIEGDGIGPEIRDVTRQVIDEAVNISYLATRQINWIEIKSIFVLRFWKRAIIKISPKLL